MTDEELKELVASLAISQQRNEIQFARTDAQLAKTDIQLEKTDGKLAKLIEQHEKTEAGLLQLQKIVEKVTTKLGDLGNIQGSIAEDLFRRNIVQLLAERGIKVKNVGFHVTMPGTSEYDIVAENGKEVVVMEVKNKLSSRHIRRFLNVQLAKFKREFPIYANYKIYGAIGSLIVSEAIEKQAIEEGLFVFTQSKNGGASIVNPIEFEAKTW
ncbi:DUF3782 domain-containing protein [Candidatus Halobeggiatoa sp. HSG11]|nr:DUF3782 domain-containing protein [Candidatus Halobeggiatoa sp. HSG11]